MKKGDKVVCIDTNSDNPNIKSNLEKSFTIGKTYTIKMFFDDAIMLEDNIGNVRMANSKHFIPLEEWRERKLNNLGI